MKKYFDQVYVINLEIRPDRLESLIKRIPKTICDFKVWKAVHGDSVTPPSYWHSGNGAWGCYRTHINILEDAMQKKHSSYLVLEDDAVFSDSFDEVLDRFMTHIPHDWEQIYLGGQLLHEIEHPPVRINDSVYMPYNVNRTHAFGVHKRGYNVMYEHLYQLPFVQGEHIDHHLGRLHEKGGIKVYAPYKWIVGQDVGSSNISGKTRDSVEFWYHPEDCAQDHDLLEDPVCIYLDGPIEILEPLRARGWHVGNWRNSDGLDRGVCEAVSQLNPELALKCWFDWVRREVIRENHVLPCLYHPRLTWDLVQTFSFARWIHVKAASVSEALGQLESAGYATK